MPIALLLLGMAEQMLELALKFRQNNAQTHEMTAQEEIDFDTRVLAIRNSPEADPNQNT